MHWSFFIVHHNKGEIEFIWRASEKRREGCLSGFGEQGNIIKGTRNILGIHLRPEQEISLLSKKMLTKNFKKQ